jgi:two-component system sensor histidine kinase YesM
LKKISDFIKNLSVSWKFILAYYAVLIIPVAIFGIYMYYRTSDSAIEQAKLVMERNLMQTRASILQKVNVIENISQIITSDKNVSNVLDYEYENEVYRLEDYQFDISPFIENIHRQNNLIYSIRIYTPTIVISEMVGSYYSVRKKDSPEWFAEMSANRPAKSGWESSHDMVPNALRENLGTPEQVLSITRPIYSPISKTSIGSLEIEVREALLFDMLRDPVISKWGRIFAADDMGRIVSNNIPELYKKNVASIGFIDYAAHETINKVEKVDRDLSVVISVPIEELGCSIVGIFPVSNFNSEVKDSIFNIILVLLISSVLLGVIIYVITNMLMGRIKKLVKAMKQVKDNNLDVSVPVRSRDEFGELALNFNHMTGRIHELVETVYKIRLMEREAELKALEAQINPHFLYNTLATISWVARKANCDEIVRISNSLAKFYRLVLSKGGSLISVREELDMVRSYLQIQKIRFEDMFDAVYEIDERACELKIVKNLLQPLVENALNHGIEPKRGHGTIIIKAECTDESLLLHITDDGVGMSPETLEEILAGRVERSGGGGYAVKNVMERLASCYGDGQTFKVFSKKGIGTKITICIRMPL